jgi:hypothetical protein
MQCAVRKSAGQRLLEPNKMATKKVFEVDETSVNQFKKPSFF